MQNLQAAARAKCPACQPLLACEKTKAARSRSKRRRRQPSLCQPPLDSIEYRPGLQNQWEPSGLTSYRLNWSGPVPVWTGTKPAQI